MTTLVDVQRLAVSLPVGGQQRPVIHDVSLQLEEGEALGLVGESGSGKSMTARTLVHQLPRGAQVSGQATFDGSPILTLEGTALATYLSQDVAVIFQDPRAHINPVRTIGDFLTEALVYVRGVAPGDAEARVTQALADVGVPNPEDRLRQYPHELSGGLLQRVMIAAAMVVEPRLLLADEPTTALDVTTQEEVMAILDEQRLERGLAMLFITHDLELAAAVCDRIAVMYAGGIVEVLPAAELEAARHPYTIGLLAARPDLVDRQPRLTVIPGRPLSAFEAPPGCAFQARCPRAQQLCTDQRPDLRPIAGHQVACHFPVDPVVDVPIEVPADPAVAAGD